MVGPVIYTFGNEAQKKHYPAAHRQCRRLVVPGLLRAGLRLRPRLAEDQGRAQGRQVHRQRPEDLDHAGPVRRLDLLPRAAPIPTAKKQTGISFLLIDMKSQGITVRPISTIDGGHEVNEVFLDNVEVPVDNLVGEENKGWDYAKFLLGNERTGIARVGVSKERMPPHQGAGREGRVRRQAADRGPALPREARRRRDRAEGARTDAAARRRRRRQARQGQAESGLLDPEDQGLGNPADHHRAADGGDRPVRRAL